MKSIKPVAMLFIIAMLSFSLSYAQQKNFNTENDLILAHYDCKTDVDDLQSAAAFTTILSSKKYSGINYHVVAGTYGIQEGLYVPPNDLFRTAFTNNWSDAHGNFSKALNEVVQKVQTTLEDGGNIWIAEGGQSDFTAALVERINQSMPAIDISQRINVVQHSDWNEEVTSPEKLEYVKRETNYVKIPDGNAAGNGSSSFKTENPVAWTRWVKDPELVKAWEMAIELSEKYNGAEGRYTNEAVLKGGFDFSDTAEVSWILGMDQSMNVTSFFENFGK